jgi:hypothetical protein
LESFLSIKGNKTDIFDLEDIKLFDRADFNTGLDENEEVFIQDAYYPKK